MAQLSLFEKAARKAQPKAPDRDRQTYLDLPRECEQDLGAFLLNSARIKQLAGLVELSKDRLKKPILTAIAGHAAFHHALPNRPQIVAGGQSCGLTIQDKSAGTAISDEQEARIEELVSGVVVLFEIRDEYRFDEQLLADPDVRAELSRAIEKSKLPAAAKKRLIRCERVRRLVAEDWLGVLCDLAGDDAGKLAEALEVLRPALVYYPRA